LPIYGDDSRADDFAAKRGTPPFVLQFISVSLTRGFCTCTSVPLIDKDDCPIVTLRLYRPKTRVEMN
jgi:hypothetical protein